MSSLHFNWDYLHTLLYHVVYPGVTLAESLTQMVGFRNALSYGYEKFNYPVMLEVLRVKVEDLRNFAGLAKGLFGT